MSLIIDQAIPTLAAVDRAVPGPDRSDNRALTPAKNAFDPDPEPFNRRGRRHIARDVRRSERSVFREARHRG